LNVGILPPEGNYVVGPLEGFVVAEAFPVAVPNQCVHNIKNTGKLLGNCDKVIIVKTRSTFVLEFCPSSEHNILFYACSPAAESS
jgi:hypothetical protein